MSPLAKASPPLLTVSAFEPIVVSLRARPLSSPHLSRGESTESRRDNAFLGRHGPLCQSRASLHRPYSDRVRLWGLWSGATSGADALHDRLRPPRDPGRRVAEWPPSAAVVREFRALARSQHQ